MLVMGYEIPIAGIMDSLLTVGMWAGVLLVVAGITGLILYLQSFKYIFIRKDVIHGRKIVHVTKFKEIKDRAGVEYYKALKWRKDLIPVAPPESVEVTSKGKKIVEAYYLDGEYIYLKDNCSTIPSEITEIMDEDLDLFPQDIIDLKDSKGFPDEKKIRKKTEEWRQEIISAKITKWKNEGNLAISAFQPFPTKQRAMLVSQFKSAQSWKKRSLMEHLSTIVTVGAAVILAIALMVFWGDMAKPLQESMDKFNANAVIQTEQLQLIKEIKQDIQIIQGEKNEQTNPPPD